MSGEKFQIQTKMYLGSSYNDFVANPKIGVSYKNVVLQQIFHPINNPDTVFCYGHALEEFAHKIDFFVNDFILVSGNSDQNVYPTPAFLKIVNHPRLILWYAQNAAFSHPKLKVLPIGIANSHWPHGNVEAILEVANNVRDKSNEVNEVSEMNKVNEMYFNFSINTNPVKRKECYEALKDLYPFLENVSVIENLQRLGTYKFCICPEGNGLDSHRIWECLYFKVVPIVIENEFIKVLRDQYDIPMIVLKDWNELRTMKLDYDAFKFDNNKIFGSILERFSDALKL
jgi:hypothetical protein